MNRCQQKIVLAAKSTILRNKPNQAAIDGNFDKQNYEQTYEQIAIFVI